MGELNSLPDITTALPLRPLDYPESPQLPATTNHNPLPELTRKQKRFVEYYLRGDSPKEAALKAGYSTSTADQALDAVLYRPAVAREIRRRQEALYRQMELTTDDVVDEIRRMAFANILDYVERDPDNPNKVYVDLRKIDRQQAAAIQELGYDADGRLKIRLVDKKGCLDTLARFKKIGEDSRHPLGADGAPLTIQALDALIQQSSNITINNTTINVGHDSSNGRLLRNSTGVANKTIEAEQ